MFSLACHSLINVYPFFPSVRAAHPFESISLDVADPSAPRLRRNDAWRGARGIEENRTKIDEEIAYAHHGRSNAQSNRHDCGKGRWGGEVEKNAEGKGRTLGPMLTGGAKFDPSGTPPGDASSTSAIRVTEDDPREYERPG